MKSPKMKLRNEDCTGEKRKEKKNIDMGRKGRGRRKEEGWGYAFEISARVNR